LKLSQKFSINRVVKKIKIQQSFSQRIMYQQQQQQQGSSTSTRRIPSHPKEENKNFDTTHTHTGKMNGLQ
jgi:hypothetical protein